MVPKKQQKTNAWKYDMRTIFLATMATLVIGFVIMITLLFSLNMRIDQMMELQGRYNYNSTSAKKSTGSTSITTSASKSSTTTKKSVAEDFKSALERKGNVLTVRIQVDHKPDRIFEGESEQKEKMPLLEVLGEIEKAKGLHVEYETVGNQTIVKAIDGIDVKNTYTLEYFVNGQLVTGDLNRAKVGVGDIVEIVTL